MRQNVRRKKASRFVLPITTRIIESALKLNGNLTAALRGVHLVRVFFCKFNFISQQLAD